MDRVQRELENSIAKLSSGRINKAATTLRVCRLLIEWNLRYEVSLAIRHAKDGQNLVDTATAKLK